MGPSGNEPSGFVFKDSRESSGCRIKDRRLLCGPSRKKSTFRGEAAFSRTLGEEKKGGKGEKKRGKKKREREEGLLLLLS